MSTTPEMILVRTEGRVGVITLNRPKALNALNDQVVNEITAALNDFESDEGIGAIVITGSESLSAFCTTGGSVPGGSSRRNMSTRRGLGLTTTGRPAARSRGRSALLSE